ncbi:MAG: hypothetical protein ABH872_02070 [Candidatus Omnitrophota bacterium]
MRLLYGLFRLFVYYLIFRFILKSIFLLVGLYLSKSKRPGRKNFDKNAHKEPTKSPYDNKKIIDAEFEEIHE